jgi:hypothetical protein
MKLVQKGDDLAANLLTWVEKKWIWGSQAILAYKEVVNLVKR